MCERWSFCSNTCHKGMEHSQDIWQLKVKCKIQNEGYISEYKMTLWQTAGSWIPPFQDCLKGKMSLLKQFNRTLHFPSPGHYFRKKWRKQSPSSDWSWAWSDTDLNRLQDAWAEWHRSQVWFAGKRVWMCTNKNSIWKPLGKMILETGQFSPDLSVFLFLI